MAYRSRLEERIAADLRLRGVDFDYEAESVPYVDPEGRRRTYRPDFTLANGVRVEAKGRFDTADRLKHRSIRRQHPALDVRFVFADSRTPIASKAGRTAADWCRLFAFAFADRRVPEEWTR